ncbi:hypothetical protein JCM5350_002185 [Sporobolomyces pararoseus]
MPIPSLPNELVDQILSYECLKEGDLIATCLVSKIWLEPSRTSLYQDVEINLCIVEATRNNPYRPGPTKYLDRKSSKLFSLLAQRPEIAAMGKQIHLYITRNDQVANTSNVSTTLPDLFSSLLRLLPCATFVYLADDEWLQRDNLGPLFPFFHRLEEVVLEDIPGTRWFDLVRQLPNLNSLTLSCVGTDGLVFSNINPTPGATGLQRLSITGCVARAFATLQTGSCASLLTLAIDLDLLPQLTLSGCPNLVQLSIEAGNRQVAYRKIVPFLEQLKISNIVKLSFSHDTVLLLDLIHHLHVYVPQSCQRIDLEGELTLNGVAAVAQTSVAQLGLVHPNKGMGRRNGRAPTILAALRAMVDGTGIEIIWR